MFRLGLLLIPTALVLVNLLGHLLGQFVVRDEWLNLYFRSLLTDRDSSLLLPEIVRMFDSEDLTQED